MYHNEVSNALNELVELRSSIKKWANVNYTIMEKGIKIDDKSVFKTFKTNKGNLILCLGRVPLEEAYRGLRLNDGECENIYILPDGIIKNNNTSLGFQPPTIKDWRIQDLEILECYINNLEVITEELNDCKDLFKITKEIQNEKNE